MDDVAKAVTIRGAPPSDGEPQDPLVGTILDDRYRVLERLGEGGMGLVYAAEHRFLKTQVAIKLLRSEAAGDEESLERFKREARSASAIGNKHIVDVRDFGLTPDGTVYVAMERIDGIDLLKTVRKGRLEWERARHVGLQICEALGAAHARGIIHRDLKAENVLLCAREGDPDFVKVVDFGIAKIEGTERITMAGRVMGTPEYMAPEQCAGLSVDERADIYALGVMLYEMVTGSLPFADRDLAKLVRMQMQQAPVPPSKVRPEAALPLAFEAVILRCLAKDPRRRFPTMDDVAAALRVAHEEGPASATRDVAASPIPPTQLSMEPAPTEAVASQPAPAAPGPTAPSPTASRPARAAPLVVAALVAVAGLAGAIWYVAGGGEAAEGSHPEASHPEASSGVPPAEGDSPPAPATAESAGSAPAAPAPAAGSARSDAIRLGSIPTGAEVYEGEALIGRAPLRIARPAEGERVTLELRLSGYRPHPVVVSALGSEELTVSLERAPAAERGARRLAPPATTEEPPPPATEEPPPVERPAPLHREFRDPWAN